MFLMSVLKIEQSLRRNAFKLQVWNVCGIALHRRDSNDLLVLTYGFYLWFHVPASRNYCPLKIYSSNEERSKSQKTYSTLFLDSAKPRRAQIRSARRRESNEYRDKNAGSFCSKRVTNNACFFGK